MAKTPSLAEKMRARLEKQAGKDIVSNVEDRVQVDSWIEMDQEFQELVGGKGVPQGHISQIYSDQPDSGKCHAKGTEVIMFDGSLKKVEDVVVGDKLMGPDSKPRTVLSLGRGREEMFEIKTKRRGDGFGCNKSHILVIRSGRKWGPFEMGGQYNISLHEYLQIPKYIREKLYLIQAQVDFPAQEVKYDPYICGVWLGDGTVGQPIITVSDPEIKKSLENFAKSIGYRQSVTNEKGNCERCSIVGERGKVNVFKAFVKKDLFNDGEKRIPKEYLVNDRKTRLEILAGLLDTDGFLDKDSKSCFEFSTKYEGLAEDFMFLVRSLGLSATRNVKYVKLKGWAEARPYQRIMVSGKTSEIPTRVERKKARDSVGVKCGNFYNFEVESVGEGDYYGFTLDGDHLYLLKDFTISHNTSQLMEIMVACQKQGGLVNLIDAEHKFSWDRFKLMGGNVEEIVHIKVDSLEEAWDAWDNLGKVALEMREEGFEAPIMAAWDSVAATIPDAIMNEKDASKAHMAVEAKINNKMVRKLRQIIRRANLTAVFINHHYMTVPRSPYEQPKEVLKGGTELYFMTTLAIRCKKGKKITRVFKGEDQRVGQTCHMETTKGHFSGRSIKKTRNVIDRGFVGKEELKEYLASLKGKI